MVTSNDANRALALPIVFVAVVVGLLTVGCSSDSPYSPVRGVVTLDGEPIADATVAFNPKDRSGRSAFGTTAADGTYELSSLKPGDGALIGDYRVTITAVDIIESEKAKALAEKFGSLSGDMPMPPPKEVWRTPRVYSKVETSGLEFTVKRDGNKADFTLKKNSGT